MKLQLLTFLLFCGVVTACKKNNSVIDPATLPVAGFSLINGDTDGHVITMATYDQYSLKDNSANAVSWHWNFGNDSVSTLQNPGLSYSKSGTYTITLSVQNKDGRKDSITQKVRVLDRVMKQVIISGIAPMAKPVNHSLDHSTIWAVLKLGDNNVNYPLPSGTALSIDAPVIFQSPVITSVDSLNMPYSFAVPGKIVVDYPALATIMLKKWGYKGIGYGLELYAQDAGGTYLLSSSYEYFFSAQTGSISWPVADLKKNVFIMKYGNVSVVCDYE